ncbi:hypothetical protein BMS3Abin02_01325 [bacterium BMS3Abin02]|nr:hypothetical protein BMS3Abin02_01325 [bacterium BMS3Abin02]GBE21728.1 hypothetical protein BMS3Bbin01_01080 [bacterium BMS3Bbin01]HDL49152.1 hypothetical protein [Actinomycetota bacterium]
MRYRSVLFVVVFAMFASACSSGSVETTIATFPPPTRVAGCGDVSFIIPSSSDATVMMGRVYTFLKKEKPEIVGTQFDATLLQITRKRGFDLITVQFSGDLGLILFVQEPVAVLHIGWEGPATSQDEIRAHLAETYPDLPADMIQCHDLSYFTAG